VPCKIVVVAGAHPSSKIRNGLEWKPRHSFKGDKREVKWYLENGGSL